MLPTMLGGQVVDVWKEMPKRDRDSYSKQKEWLLKNLNKHDREELKVKFYTLNQKDDESCESFSGRLKDLFCKAFKREESEENSSSTFIKRFFRGIRPAVQVALATNK